jgi:exopolyphosphatase/guanosine-5'-triphosphate,3'-diphosphate pyrophosphatase
MRVGAVDLGSNSTRLLVADVDGGRVQEVARVRNVLSDYRRELERLGAERVLTIGTSAVRDAENGEAFLGEIEWSYGFATRLVTGDEEAELTLRGVATGLTLDEGTLVLDVGGGSTELTTTRERTSIDVGSVRLTERHLRSDPPSPGALAAAASEVRDLLPQLEPTTAVGVAGTITTLAALELGGYDPDRVHGFRLSRAAAERQLELLASLPLAERRELPGLEPERAPVIVGGAVIVCNVLDRYGLQSLQVSERDLLHGAALEAAELPEPVEGDAPPGAYTCC